jgi:F-type H+-transporting ATPase subunit alpha
MKQPQYSPMSVAQMAVTLFAVNEGLLDDVAVNKVRAFEDGLQAYMQQKHQALLDRINTTPEFNDVVAGELREAVKSFKANYIG